MGWRRLKGNPFAGPPESAVRVLPNGVVYVPVEIVYYRGRPASGRDGKPGKTDPRSRDRRRPEEGRPQSAR